MTVIGEWVRRWIFLPLHASGAVGRWPLAAALLCWALLPLLRRHPRQAVRRTVMLSLAVAAFALCWLSLYDAPVAGEAPAEASLLALADDLCASLNAGTPPHMETQQVLAEARLLTPEATARFRTGHRPWLLARLHAAGLFLPFINEIWLDTAEPEILLPFTAVHERFHASGFADEGTANRMAYEACVAAGGGFAHSARIYAAKLLWRTGSPAVRRRLYTELSEENLALLIQAGAFAETDSVLPAWVRHCLPGANSYDALIAYLADSLRK